MTRFSIGRDDDDPGPGPGPGPGPSNTSRMTKRLRITPSSTPPRPPSPPSPPPPPARHTTTRTHHEYLPSIEEVSLVDVGVEVEEGEYEDETQSSESEYASDEEIQEALAAHSVASESETAIGGSSSSSIAVTLADPDVFDCPICLDSLTIPVFQCENGHIACASCCSKIANKCPSCSWPIGYNRCRAIEKVLESILIPCWNKKYGCTVTLPYSEKTEHEKSCVHLPCPCPHENCEFLGSSTLLFAHCKVHHPESAMEFRFSSLFSVDLEKDDKSVILREQFEGTILMLKHSSDPMGSIVNVESVGSMTQKKEYNYIIICRDGDDVIQIQASVENPLQGFVSLKRFLLVPSEFVGASGKLKLEVCIRKSSPSLFA